MSKDILKLRDGYKTMSVHRNPDGTLRILIHRPPQAWLVFNLDAEQGEQIRSWLAGETHG